MNKTRTILTALSVVFMCCGMVQAASGPFGYDLQKDMHRSEIKAKEQEKAKALEQAKTNADNKAKNMGKSVEGAKDIDEAKSKLTQQYKEIMKSYCDEIRPYGTAEENAYCDEWVKLDPTAYGAGTDMVRLIDKMFYLPNTPRAFYSFVPLKDLYVDSVSHDRVYYTNPTMKSATARYKQGNYTGCLQELYDYIKKHPGDPYAYYYMGLAYIKLGETTAAKNCFQKVINCNVHGQFLKVALKNRDCLSGGGFCMWDEMMGQLETGLNEVIDKTDTSSDDDLDKFIKAPYTGNGFSPELQKEYQQKELENLQKTINRKKELNESDFENIRRIEELNKSEVVTGEKIAMITGSDGGLPPSDADVLDAIDVLKRAGLNISAGNFNSDSDMSDVTQTSFEKSPSVFTPNQDLQAMQMLLGNNNSQNNDPMMSMLPYMMQNDGKNIDPQVLQAMMMNSMMSGLSGLNSTDNNK